MISDSEMALEWPYINLVQRMTFEIKCAASMD